MAEKNLPPWSHTFFSDYGTCPSRAYHKYVAKDVPKEETDALKEGRRVHDALDARVTNGVQLPDIYQKYEFLAAPLAAYRPIGELKLGILWSGKPCGFFDKEVWGRGVIDVPIINAARTSAILFDWKTGKRKEDPTELRLQALLLHAQHPTLQHITGHYIWLRDLAIGESHNLSDVDATWEEVRYQWNVIFNHAKAGHWPEREGPLCSYCPVKKCRFWRPSPEGK
ncbi:MAG: hypothetical protein C5B50_00825 [Verrucomicrobia bacterium]|nr:MAG: hypothetical protein C5B50_00825 [Verrucomicrobiota bacterium]